jgi:hypothetical protein
MASKKYTIKLIALLTVGVIGIYLIACFVSYRIPTADEPVYIDGYMLYKLTENTGTNRQLFEELVMGNRLIRLTDESIWYVSKRDHKILWPEDPHEMHKKGYTIKTQLKTQKLLFGGYSKAEIYELDIISEAPTIRE